MIGRQEEERGESWTEKIERNPEIQRDPTATKRHTHAQTRDGEIGRIRD